MKRVLTAAVLIPLVLLAVFRAPNWLFALLVGAVALLALHEYLGMVAAYGFAQFRALTMILTGVIFAGIALHYSYRHMDYIAILVAVLLFFAPSLYLAVGMREEDLRAVLPGAAMSFFGVFYVGLSVLCLVLLRAGLEGWFAVLFTFFCVWVGDTAAYYVGRSIGRTKFAARISPKKTWEGAIGSVAGAVIVAILFTVWAPRLQQWLYSMQVLPGGAPQATLVRPSFLVIAIFAVLINVAAQLGDLFESLIKRGAGIKDSGTMLPGHGGILDRIDALLFAAPVAFILFFRFGVPFFRLARLGE